MRDVSGQIEWTWTWSSTLADGKMLVVSTSAAQWGCFLEAVDEVRRYRDVAKYAGGEAED